MNTYQIADNNLALSSASHFGGSRLGRSTASRPGILLDAANRGSSLGAGRAPLRWASVTSRLALGRDDIVERLIELARHCGGRCALKVDGAK